MSFIGLDCVINIIYVTDLDYVINIMSFIDLDCVNNTEY